MTWTDIVRLGHLGDGIGADGRRHPLALPGDRIDANDQLDPSSPHRTPPPCPHFGTCGGCALQHARDSFVATWKAEVVATALDARGLTADVTTRHTSPPGSRRRAVLAARRTKKGVQIGFHKRASDEIVDLEGCLVLPDDLRELRPALGELTRIGASRKGTIRIGVTGSDAGWDLDIRDAKPLDGPGRAAVTNGLQARGIARLSWNGEVLAQIHPPEQPFGPARVLPPPGAFLQATRAGEAAMRTVVEQHLAGARAVADLFCGCGTFTLPMAAHAQVHAVEAQKDHLAALDRGWRRASTLHQITTEARDLFTRPLLPAELTRFDAVIIDPPRAGAEAQMTQIAQSTVPKVVAISCNPVSFARDAAILVAGGYHLHQVDVIDQFRWSTHVELVALFSR